MNKEINLDAPELFHELSLDEQTFLLEWIEANLQMIKTINTKKTSYGIKHYIKKNNSKVYFTNGAMKGAMVASGYKVKNAETQNWNFNVSSKSPAFIE